MKITFVSNYINHHQIPVSNRLYERLGADYTFMQTEPMEAERVQMGWSDVKAEIPYLKCYYEEPEYCKKLILNSDVVIFGGTDEEAYIQERLQARKIILRYSERLYKTGQWKAISPRGIIKKYKDHTQYRNAPVYLMCAGAYVPSDFSLVHAYPDKMLKWGYFPETKTYDVGDLLQKKKKNTLLWAGRFIDWKHPELPILLAEALKKKGYTFELSMIGGGEMELQIKEMIRQKGLQDKVKLLGYLEPRKVREKMEESSIYLFTSDYQEGWGAVCNEAMNSGCAVVASHAIGAVPYLLKHGENGVVFRSGDKKDFVNQVEELLHDANKCNRLGKAAYETIVNQWNAEMAADRLLTTIGNLQFQQELNYFLDGPCSAAEVIPERKMFSVMRNRD